MQRDRLPFLLVPVAALIAVLPLLLHGCSCGHDFNFHLLNWMEAARQFTHGTLHPHWAYTAAYNAGEPRFVFYPPASWTLGAILGLLFPWTWTPILYTWLALTASGFALHRLAREFAAPAAALLASVLYTVNPYMLFTAYERTAYAELLAAAWIPLLLHAILRRRLTSPRLAIPIALLWITNAPAAVMSCYALALLALIRMIRIRTASTPNTSLSTLTTQEEATNPGAPSFVVSSQRVGYSRRQARTAVARTAVEDAPGNTDRRQPSSVQQARTILGGTALGLGLAAFYILPAAYERRFVQIAMALTPGMRISDNFLFHHTGDLAHDAVLHTASSIAVLLLATTAITITFAFRNKSQQTTNPGSYLDSEMGASRKSGVPAQIPDQRPRSWCGGARPPSYFNPEISSLLTSLAVLTATIALLLTPLSSFLWRHAPELAFLQFPWRLLAILAAVLSLALALSLTHLRLKPALTSALALLLAGSLTWPAYLAFHQPCHPEDTVSSTLALFRSSSGTEPTDEYTPTTADNDSLAQSNPPWWLSPDPDAKAPADSHPGPAPTRLTLNSPIPQTLILNLRDYPSWRITRNHLPVTDRPQRDDGLIAVPLPAGASTITLAYAQTRDQTLGDIITTLSLLLLLLALFQGRRQRTL